MGTPYGTIYFIEGKGNDAEQLAEEWSDWGLWGEVFVLADEHLLVLLDYALYKIPGVESSTKGGELSLVESYLESLSPRPECWLLEAVENEFLLVSDLQQPSSGGQMRLYRDRQPPDVFYSGDRPKRCCTDEELERTRKFADSAGKELDEDELRDLWISMVQREFLEEHLPEWCLTPTVTCLDDLLWLPTDTFWDGGEFIIRPGGFQPPSEEERAEFFDRILECGDCNGTGQLTSCPSCAKRIICRRCRGLGRRFRFFRCGECGGSGYRKCRACHGKFTPRECPRCKGTGRR